MKIQAAEYDPRYAFEITGVSYVGTPKSNTAMFATQKVAHLLENLSGVEHCLIFVNEGAEILPAWRDKHCFVAESNPEAGYGRLAERLWGMECAHEAGLRYTLAPGGYYLGEGATLGEGVYIEPTALIGHGVHVGDGARIEAGAAIYHAVVGKGCHIKGNSVIGSQSFFHYFDENNIKHRLYQLGNVVLEDEVEVGSCATVNRSVASSTILRRGAMIDDHVYVPHDVEVGEGARIVGGTMLGGFCKVGRRAFIGLGAVLRNRISVGDDAVIGIGAVVLKDVPPGVVVVGNPGRVLIKQEGTA